MKKYIAMALGLLVSSQAYSGLFEAEVLEVGVYRTSENVYVGWLTVKETANNQNISFTEKNINDGCPGGMNNVGSIYMDSINPLNDGIKETLKLATVAKVMGQSIILQFSTETGTCLFEAATFGPGID